MDSSFTTANVPNTAVHIARKMIQSCLVIGVLHPPIELIGASTKLSTYPIPIFTVSIHDGRSEMCPEQHRADNPYDSDAE